MIEINLIPDVKIELLKANRQRRNVISISIVVAIASVAAVALLTFYAFAVQGIAGTLADSSIKDETKKLQSIEDLAKTLTIQNQLEQLSTLHDTKHINSRLFDIISTTVPTGENKVVFSRLALDAEENTITIEGEARNGYEALEVFKKTIAQTKFKYTQDKQSQTPVMIASSLSDGERRYGEDDAGRRVLRFTLSFSYPDELFSPTAEFGQIIAPSRKNATDSAGGVPKSLFTNQPTEENE